LRYKVFFIFQERPPDGSVAPFCLTTVYKFFNKTLNLFPQQRVLFPSLRHIQAITIFTTHEKPIVMNIRKIKLALTVGLMNLDPQGNALQFVRELVTELKEAGSFLGLSRVKSNDISETYALQFEGCTIALDLVSNPKTQSHSVQGFRLQ
jgi:hypothetical protein